MKPWEIALAVFFPVLVVLVVAVVAGFVGLCVAFAGEDRGD